MEVEFFGRLYWPVLWADQALTEVDGFEIFNADATDETKICCLDKIFPLILSGQFHFCPPVRRGPKVMHVLLNDSSPWTPHSLRISNEWQEKTIDPTLRNVRAEIVMRSDETGHEFWDNLI